MAVKIKASRVRWVAIGGGAIIGLLGMLLAWAPIGEALVRWSYDLPFVFHNHDPGTNLVIIYMDEKSHDELDQRFNAPWDRKLHAELVRRLTTNGASLIFFDVIFSDREPDKDDELADAFRKHGKVFLGAALDKKGEKSFLSVLNSTLTNAAAGTGLIDFPQEDAFHGARQLWTGTAQHPTATWLAAKRIGGTLDDKDRLVDRWISYYGKSDFVGKKLDPGELPSYPYHEVLSNAVPAGAFQNKAVFIGSRLPVSYIGAARDEFATVYTWHNKRSAPGVEVHATAFLNLWAGHWLTRIPLPVELGLLLMAGLGLGWGLSLLEPLSAVAFALGAVVMVCLLALILVQQRLWFSWLIIAGIQVPLALAWAITSNAVRAHTEKRLLMASLSVHFSAARVKQILRQPELLKPGATRQTVSILFSDIEGFSKVTEMMRPEDLVKLLNKYYETAIASIYETDGTVMDLIGDAIFAIWNAPEEQADHQDRAFRAALLLQQKLKEFRESERGLPLQTRVGMHTGTVCVGNIGSSARFDYTAIGDEVNMASRLEGLNKHLGTLTLATREIQAGFEERYVWRLVGHFKFKGKFKPVEVYELIGPADKEAETKPWREAFAEGLHQFQWKNFDRAEAEFKRTLELRPEDGPANYYLKRTEELCAKPPPSDWKGEIDLESK